MSGVLQQERGAGGRLAASASAAGDRGAEEAIASAVRGLGGERPSLVVLFADHQLASDAVLEQAAHAAPECEVVGMTADGLLAAEGVRHDGCSALAFGAGTVARVGVGHGVTTDSFAAGRAAAADAVRDLDAADGHAVVLLFLDPMVGDEGEVIDGAYDAVGAGFALAGGGANGDAPVVFAHGAAHTDAVVAVALVCDRPIGVGIAHGCRPLPMPAFVTRTDGPVVRELDGRPAQDVYLERLGLPPDFDDASFERLLALHPLAQRSVRGELRLRHVRGPHAGRGLMCASRIPANAAVWITEQTPEGIVESARDAVRDALASAGGAARAVLIFDCAARKRALGEHVDDEARALAGAFDDPPALAGLFTRGEAGRIRGAKGDRNHAVVVVAFA